MVAGLRLAATLTDGMAAGRVLAEAGWAVFPVPLAHPGGSCDTCRFVYEKKGRECHGKHDQGPRAAIYAQATTDADAWAAMCASALERHPVLDVNIAVSPWRCAVPLIGLDLDGRDAVAAFSDYTAPDTLRVTTAGKGGGMHVYVSGASKPLAGTHTWGGEIRSVYGHLMLPPSLIWGTRDYYTPRGERFLPAEALGDVMSTAKTARSRKGGTISDADIDPLIDRLSVHPATGSARQRLIDRLAAIEAAPPGERYPTTMRAVASAVALAHMNALPLRWALSVIESTYSDAVAMEDRDPHAQVRDMAAWVLGEELS